MLIAVIAVIAGCSKNEAVDPTGDNQSSETFKDYEYTANLMAGQHIYVGTVSWLDTENGSFKVTYTLTNGWTMSESHVFVGLKSVMPVNKPGAPKIGKFPYKEVHSPAVTTYTYTIPSDGFPLPPDYTDLAIAAHAVVNNPDGGTETAWAECNYTFTDKGWGTWSFFVDGAVYIPDETIYYAIQQNSNGDLVLVHINGGSDQADVILSENVASSGVVTAAAYDPITANLFFVIGNSLFVNNMNSDSPSQFIGNLLGQPAGGAFVNGYFYYFNNDPNSTHFNELIQVQIIPDGNGGFTIDENSDFSSSIYSDITVSLNITDLAVSSDGTVYLVGTDNVGTVYLTSYTSENGFYAEATQLNGDAQITFGVDGELYALHMTDGGEPIIEILDPEDPGSPPIPPDDDDDPIGGDNDDLGLLAGSDVL